MKKIRPTPSSLSARILNESMDPQSINQQPPPSINSSPIPPPSQSSKLPLILTVFFLLLLVGAGSYFLGQKSLSSNKTITIQPSAIPTNQSTPTTTPTITAGETVNWKTYIDKDNSFSIKYPDDKNKKVIVDGINAYIGLYGIGNANVSFKIYPEDYEFPPGGKESDFGGDLALNIKVEKNKNSIDEWLNQYECIKKDCPNMEGDLVAAERKSFNINNSSAYEVNWGEERVIIILHNNNLYIIEGYGYKKDVMEDLFNKMFSTFKFLK